MKPILAILTVFLTLALCQCSRYDLSRKVVEQGNLLPQEKIQRLHLGMSKQEVNILMGTSLLSPTFNSNRWDYAYTLRKGSAEPRVKRLVLYFSKDKLIKIESL